MDMTTLLSSCVQHSASDLHIRVHRKACLRVSGRIRSLETAVVSAEHSEALMREILPERLAPELEETGSADFGYGFEGGVRFRVNVFKEKAGYGIVCRRIPQKIMSFDEIGLPTHVKDLLTRPRGLILVTGPTGSGKTTTLATMIDEINSNEDKHIVTIEDPIEYYHEQKRCIISQREVGVHTSSFSEAMRRSLRQDPDVIMLGEMRDYETISTAITAAETGHLVFGTLHTTGSARTVDRIIDSFPKDQQEQIRTQLALSIVAVISQLLVPKKDGGVIAVFEVMINTSAIENHIRKGETYKITSDIQTGKKRGMILLDDHLLELMREGLITRDTVLEYAQDRVEMRTRLA
ncbi:MAG: type IV pilus twitching motility protein PilT [Planctomycetes bacterium]|nr:type IV pilus twitching motility protein PilT [Planctomycetota bacterium]